MVKQLIRPTGFRPFVTLRCEFPQILILLVPEMLSHPAIVARGRTLPILFPDGSPVGVEGGGC
jgi:hypothetical protein